MSVSPLPSRPRVGVLAVQGAFREHQAMLSTAGADAVLVRTPAALSDIAGLVVPGGESTTLRIVAGDSGLLEAIRAARAGGMPMLGTCAGLIALADGIADGDTPLVGGPDVTVARNAYRSQVASFEAMVDVLGFGDGPCEGVFIRAPRIIRTGPAVEVLASFQGDPVVVRQDGLLGVAFHPELTDDSRFHRWLVERARRYAAGRTNQTMEDSRVRA